MRKLSVIEIEDDDDDELKDFQMRQYWVLEN
jgi:hypothetical protein